MSPIKTYTITNSHYIHDGYFIMIGGLIYWTSINRSIRKLKAV